MSSNHGSPILHTLKVLLITALKLGAIGVAFALKLSGFALSKLGELFERLSGHGKNH